MDCTPNPACPYDPLAVTYEAYRSANLTNWNERVPIHAASRTYDLDGIVTDPNRVSGIVAFDAPRLGDVRGKRLLHLQCHIGTDTLSWARLGANVIGVDFSAPALAIARDAADRAGLNARFVEADVYEAPAALDGATFDVIYTGVGSLCWLPDIDGWADVIASLLKPGGTLYVREGHPMMQSMNERAQGFIVRYPYFQTKEPMTFDDPSTYTDGDAKLTATRTYEWNHSIGEIISAVLRVNCTITAFEEHRFLEWPFWSWMERTEDDRYVLPEPLRDRMPLMFTLIARKPSDGN